LRPGSLKPRKAGEEGIELGRDQISTECLLWAKCLACQCHPLLLLRHSEVRLPSAGPP
jgi:hypothetical protein